MTRVNYLLVTMMFLVTVMLVSWASGALLSLFSNYSGSFFLAAVGCWLAVIFLALLALIRRRWRELAISSVTLFVIWLANFGQPEPMMWFSKVGFRIHVAPVEQYLSRCRLVAFLEGGIKQQLGQCETGNFWGDGRVTIFYDTTGQFALLPALRTEAWKDAMYNFSPHCFFTDTAVANHVFEKFYSVFVALQHEGGC